MIVLSLLELQQKAVQEGIFHWQIGEDLLSKLAIQPVSTFNHSGVVVGYILGLTLQEAETEEIFRPIVEAARQLLHVDQFCETCLIAQAYVLGGSRKGGTYSTLFRRFENVVWEMGYRNFVAGIRRSNTRSMAVHTKKGGLGFSVVLEVGNGGPLDWLIVTRKVQHKTL